MEQDLPEIYQMRSKTLAAYNRRTSGFIAILGLMTVNLAAQETRAAAPTRVLLQLSVTDCWGGRVPPTIIHLVSPGGTIAVLHYPDQRAVSVPRGPYTVIAESREFSRAAKTIHTDRQGGLISLCLTPLGLDVTGSERELAR